MGFVFVFGAVVVVVDAGGHVVVVCAVGAKVAGGAGGSLAFGAIDACDAREDVALVGDFLSLQASNVTAQTTTAASIAVEERTRRRGVKAGEPPGDWPDHGPAYGGTVNLYRRRAHAPVE